MSVSLYFGLPGSGKTTLLCYHAIRGLKSKRYQHIYTNVGITVPGVTYISNDCIGKCDLSNCLLLIDEATLFADSRDHKNFPKHQIEYFLLHRHYNCDIILYTQQWDGVDRKIRVITDRVYYVHKGFFTRKFITKYYRIPYGIIIPDPKNKSSGEKLGDIIQGYSKPNILVRLFATRYVFRPLYYQYFDSWESKPLPELPPVYQPYFFTAEGKQIKTLADLHLYKRSILLRSIKDSFRMIPMELRRMVPSLPRRSGRYSNKNGA